MVITNTGDSVPKKTVTSPACSQCSVKKNSPSDDGMLTFMQCVQFANFGRNIDVERVLDGHFLSSR